MYTGNTVFIFVIVLLAGNEVFIHINQQLLGIISVLVPPEELCYGVCPDGEDHEDNHHLTHLHVRLHHHLHHLQKGNHV